MSRDKVEIVRAVYDAVARRDTAAVLAFYDPEVEWDYSRGALAGLMGPGVYHGHEGLRRWNREWYTAWEGRASGAEVEMSTRQAGVWTIRGGKLVRVVWFPSVEEAREAVGLGA
jgi:ketosteroid isomerase-like protein